MTTETISGDDIVPCDECGEPKPRARYHTAHDCVRYLRRQIVKKDDALRLAHARLANVNARPLSETVEAVRAALSESTP